MVSATTMAPHTPAAGPSTARVRRRPGGARRRGTRPCSSAWRRHARSFLLSFFSLLGPAGTEELASAAPLQLANSLPSSVSRVGDRHDFPLSPSPPCRVGDRCDFLHAPPIRPRHAAPLPRRDLRHRRLANLFDWGTRTVDIVLGAPEGWCGDHPLVKF